MSKRSFRACLRSLSVVLLAATFSAYSWAALKVEKKIFQVGGPETRIRCINELKTKGVPKCSVHGFEVRCRDTWVKTCSEAATDFKQHSFFLVVTGPDAEKAVEKFVRDAIETALLAAVAAAAATPGEVAARVAVAVTAFKITLAEELSRRPALAAIKEQYKLSLQEREHW